MTIRKIDFTIALILAIGSTASAASFSGTWKINLAKSQLSGQTVTFDKTPDGKFRFDSGGFTYDFDLTGKEYPTPDGGTTSWKAPDAATWEATNRMNGKVVASYRLSLKGNTVVSVMRVTKPDGAVIEETATATRLSGGPGFLGKWRMTNVKGTPTTLEIVTDASNHITLKYPEFQVVCNGSFDGKDYVLTTAGADSKQTATFEKTGPSSFRTTTKLNGKPISTDVFTVSADGKVLTDDANSASVNEPTKSIYERQ